MIKAIYPGTFDPFTNGHLDILSRASLLFDKVVVGIAEDTDKETLFTLEERRAFVEDGVRHLKNVEVVPFKGLLMHFVVSQGATAIIRGLRAVSDFEYEFQMALMNRRQTKNIETVFLMSGFKWFYTSSKLIKEVASFGGSVKTLVPDNVNQKLMEKFNIKNHKN